ncbi:hypothetical protein LPJ61_002505 [Coemansia biformis]|uniref:PHD-type domain-containing protein n=1 Tax=Coemansia biformis TaxID=1286918 RepID=A0A9W7YCZ8_9FUNG|nr:hypothetical protein LPJ61_002505 [Coemansia biformis]
MPRPVAPRPASGSDASAAGERTACGLRDDLPGGFAGGGMGLGHGDMLTRKRSLDNMENVPPFGLDGAAPLTAPGIDKPAASLLDIAAQQLSQKQRKNRRTVITASSPGGHQRMGANPRRATMLADASLLRSQAPPLPRHGAAEGSAQLNTPRAVLLLPAPSLPLQPHTASSGRQTPVLQAVGGGSGSASSTSSSVRLRRMPKRNLKPLDFSGLHRPKVQPAHSAVPITAGATAGSATAINKPGAHSSESPGITRPSGANILSLPVSPAQSSPVSALSLEALGLPESSPAFGPVRGAAGSLLEIPGSANPTPPSTVPRRQPAFSGLLASAYRRAATKRSSKRALCFESSPGPDDESLHECDPVLGPRCPVIGDPRGMFGLHRSGIDDLQREQAERSHSRFSEMARTVREAQAQFEAAVVEQTRRDHPPGRKPGRPPNSVRGRGRGKSVGPGAPLASKRPISECKYCGKQYKYHAKLASHEQHCSLRLEALLYSADEHEQHTIHCVCGPRHERPVGERDDLPMVQCDNCLLWLHIECVDIDEDNLPEEFFCPRCEDGFGGGMAAGTPSTPKRRPGRGGAAGMMSPESHRLAALLADVPNNDGSETEEEPMCLRISGRPRVVKTMCSGADMSSEDTMSISDVAEVARFHRQGSAARRHRSPPAPRLAQSESNISAALTPSRRRVRSGIGCGQQTVHTDALSSDFLGLPLPESIFSEKPCLVAGIGVPADGPGSSFIGAPVSIAPGLCTQQSSMADLSQFLSDSQQQLSLAQLTSMLGAVGPAGAGALLSTGSSGYLEQALADFGLGSAGPALAAGPGAHRGPAGGAEADPSLPELADLPVNEFSALLESIASGNPGTDADPYSSIGADDLLGIAAGTAVTQGRGGGARVLGGGVGCSIDVGHGSSSTITIMRDSSNLGSQDNDAGGAAAWACSRPAPARPPPGLPGIARERVGGGGKTKRSSLLASAPGSAAGSTGGVAAAKHAPIVLSLPSNPPSATGIRELNIEQLIDAGSASQPLLDWAVDGDMLERELEGLINFDA